MTPGSVPARLPAAVWVLGGVSLLMDISSEMVHSLLPLFLVGSLGVSVAALGWIEGLAQSTALLVKLFSGLLSDGLGRRKGLAVLGYALGALSKPLFALAGTASAVLVARLIDRTGKGLRGAPRDALLADLTPPAQRGAAFGLRQALDSAGAVLGPLLAALLVGLWALEPRAVFWLALLPGVAAVVLLVLGVHEAAPSRPAGATLRGRLPLRQLDAGFWQVAAVGAVFTLARFSEAFLLLRAHQLGVALAWVPLVMVAMNLVYALSAYPLGRLADRHPPRRLLAIGLLLLIGADLLLASAQDWRLLLAGVALWGLHLGMTQGLLAAMVAASAPAGLRGSAFGFFNLLSGAALLAASVLAGWLWQTLGAPASFLAGAGFAALALLGLCVFGRRN